MSEEIKKEEEKPKEEIKTDEPPKENNIEIKEEKKEEIKNEEPPKAEENIPGFLIFKLFSKFSYFNFV